MSDSVEEQPSIREALRRREASSRIMEIYLWILAAMIVAGGIWIDIIGRRAYLFEVLSIRYFEMLLALLTLFFPFVFRLIFGVLPLEALRRKRAQQPADSDRPTVTTQNNIRSIEVQVFSESPTPEQLSEYTAAKLFAYFSSTSRKLADSIYSRAGVYLLVGVLVAFSGLIFFYGQTAQLPKEVDGYSMLLILAPKFGILFFIEFVALFFLRQYRAAMDEFRYYEAIKRNREESLALLQVAKESGKVLDPLELIKHDSFFSKAGTLSKGETTEIIESRKLEKSEMDLLEKVIDVISKSKR